MLWASCLPLTSLAAPLLPLRTALRHARDADGPLGIPPALATVDAALELDSWLDDVAVHRPVLLVVDDVQWADQSSLDALMYVLAGHADRRVGVLVTLRPASVPSSTAYGAGLPTCGVCRGCASWSWADWTGLAPAISSRRCSGGRDVTLCGSGLTVLRLAT